MLAEKMTALCFILVGLLFTAASSFPTSTDVQNYTLPEPGTCGISLAERIGGGKKTALNAYPWTALIGAPTSKGPLFFCGGSLISDQFVLTAAHCLLKVPVWVRLGEWDIESEVDCDEYVCSDKPIDLYVENYVLHENYHPVHSFNDIALLKLPRPVSFTEFISPVCLPLSDDMNEQPKIGRILTVIGWGETERGMETPLYGSRYKKEAKIPVLHEGSCGGPRPILSSEFCADNSTDSQSCSGDSGGSVVAAENDGYWYQYGIVSYGSKCGDTPPYGVYVRVSSFLPWIMETMSQLDDTNNSGSADE